PVRREPSSRGWPGSRGWPHQGALGQPLSPSSGRSSDTGPEVAPDLLTNVQLITTPPTRVSCGTYDAPLRPTSGDPLMPSPSSPPRYDIAGRTITLPCIVRDASAGTALFDVDLEATRTLLPRQFAP